MPRKGRKNEEIVAALHQVEGGDDALRQRLRELAAVASGSAIGD